MIIPMATILPIMSRVLLLVAVVLGQAQEQDMTWKLIACMQVTRIRLVDNRMELTELAGKSKFPHKDVLTKCMAMMIMECVERIPIENCKGIIENSDDQAAIKQFIHYTTLPSQPFLTEESIALTADEELLVKDIQSRYEQSKSSQTEADPSENESEMPMKEQPFGTSLWLIYVLAVFLAFAGFVLYGIKRLGDRSKKAKKTKKQ